jgi:hypothetical protein
VRTPKETLERLAEVAPKEWGMCNPTYAKGVFSLHYKSGEIYVNPAHGDVLNAEFTALLKEKLREMGYRLMLDTFDQDDWSIIVYTSDRKRIVGSGDATTEWQAVAEAMIGVLENE